MAAINLREEAFLAVEMVADAGDVHLRGGGELAHRHAIEAALGEQPLARAQDALARSLLVLGGGRSHRASCDRLARCALRIRLVHALQAACRAANVNAADGCGEEGRACRCQTGASTGAALAPAPPEGGS